MYKLTVNNIFYFRYEIMKSCWKPEPIDRPDFSELVVRINNLKDMSQTKGTIRKASAAYLPVYS